MGHWTRGSQELRLNQGNALGALGVVHLDAQVGLLSYFLVVSRHAQGAWQKVAPTKEACPPWEKGLWELLGNCGTPDTLSRKLDRRPSPMGGGERASLLCFSIPAWIEVGGAVWLLLPQPPQFVPMWLLWAQGPMLLLAQLMEQLSRARQPSLWRKVAHFGGLLERGEWYLAPFPVPSKQVLETKHPPSWTHKRKQAQL